MTGSGGGEQDNKRVLPGGPKTIKKGAESEDNRELDQRSTECRKGSDTDGGERGRGKKEGYWFRRWRWTLKGFTRKDEQA